MDQERNLSLRKRKLGPKAPNPLSVKKKKKVNSPSDEVKDKEDTSKEKKKEEEENTKATLTSPFQMGPQPRSKFFP